MKSYVISVSLGTGCYRHIQISASATLYRLHKAILNAFDFEDDHQHAFFMDNHYWGHGDAYFSMEIGQHNRLTRNYRLSKFGFTKGSVFKYLFDYGDEWRFQCKVLRELEEKTDLPRVIRSVGASPEQYPEYDEEWDDEDDWDDEDWDEEADLTLSPEEAQLLYDTLDIDRDIIDSVKRYFRAAANFYGIITLKQIFEIYNSQNKSVDAIDFLKLAYVFSMEVEESFLVLWEDNQTEEEYWQMEVILAEMFAGSGQLVFDIRRQQKGKQCYVPPKQELLCYEQRDYIPMTPANMKLKKFFQKHLCEDWEDAWMNVINMIRMDARLSDVMEQLKLNTNFFRTKADIMELAAIYQEVNNSTRMMAHGGYTPTEMAQLFPRTKAQQQAVPIEGQLDLFSGFQSEQPQKLFLTIVGKPPKNAPCPCGSGRKYKNCCGKGD